MRAAVSYRKLDIAHEYLEVSAELFLAGRFFPALHLAGAAEELYGAVIQARTAADAQKPLVGGIRIRSERAKPFIEDLVAAIQRGQEKRGTQVMPADEIKGAISRAKNNAKHATRGKAFNLTMTADAEHEAMLMIALATFNCMRLRFTPKKPVRIVLGRFMGWEEHRAASEWDW